MKILFFMVVSSFFCITLAMGSNPKPGDSKEAKNAQGMQVVALENFLAGKSPMDETMVRSAVRQMDGIADRATCVRWANEYVASYEEASLLNRLGVCFQRLFVKWQSRSAGILAYTAFGKAALMGEVHAQNNIAYCCEYGVGMEKDEKSAVALYQKFAKKNPAAKDNYARCLQNGIGVTKDEKTAAVLYKEASDQGNAYATFHYGCCLLYAIGVVKDVEKAVKVLQQAAEAGSKEAMDELYQCCRHGWGSAEDRAKAVELLSQRGYKRA